MREPTGLAYWLLSLPDSDPVPELSELPDPLLPEFPLPLPVELLPELPEFPLPLEEPPDVVSVIVVPFSALEVTDW